MEGRGVVLCHIEGLRGLRHGKEVHQHGKGDSDEGLDLQRVHQGGGVGQRRRRPAVSVPVMDLCNAAVSTTAFFTSFYIQFKSLIFSQPSINSGYDRATNHCRDRATSTLESCNLQPQASRL
jgi:hypothetical protein